MWFFIVKHSCRQIYYIDDRELLQLDLERYVFKISITANIAFPQSFACMLHNRATNNPFLLSELNFIISIRSSRRLRPLSLYSCRTVFDMQDPFGSLCNDFNTHFASTGSSNSLFFIKTYF